MEFLDVFEGFDWSALGENASSLAIEIAKSETKSIAEKSIHDIKDVWKKIDWPGKQKKIQRKPARKY